MNPVYGAGGMPLPTQPRPASRNNDGAVPAQAMYAVAPAVSGSFSQVVDANGVNAMPVDAYKNNERLFPILLNGLADDKGYAASATKLAGWLSVDKAYYSAARPWVVDFLQTAQTTVRTACNVVLNDVRLFHVSQCPPTADAAYWVDPYVVLVQTVRQFEHLFVESELRTRLTTVFRSVDSGMTWMMGAVVSSGPVRRQPPPPVPQPPPALMIGPPPVILPNFHASAPSPRSPQVPAPAYPAFVPPVNRDAIASPIHPSPTAAAGPSMARSPFVQPPPRPQMSSASSTPPIGHSHASPTSHRSSTTAVASPTSSSSPSTSGASALSAPKLKLKSKLKGKKLSGLVGAFDYLDSDLEWYMKQKEKEKEKEAEEPKEGPKETEAVPLSVAVAEGENKDREPISHLGAVGTVGNDQHCALEGPKQESGCLPLPLENPQNVAPDGVQPKDEEDDPITLTEEQPVMNQMQEDNGDTAAQHATEAGDAAESVVETKVRDATSEELLDLEPDALVQSPEPMEDYVATEKLPSTGLPTDMRVAGPSAEEISQESMEVDDPPQKTPAEGAKDNLASPTDVPGKMADAASTGISPLAAGPSLPPEKKAFDSEPTRSKTPKTPPPPFEFASTHETPNVARPVTPVLSTPHLDLSTILKSSPPLRPTVKGKPGRKGPPGLRILPVLAPSNPVLEDSSEESAASLAAQPVAELSSFASNVVPHVPTKSKKSKRRGPPGIRVSDLARTLEAQNPHSSDRESSPETTLMASIGKPKSPAMSVRKPRLASPASSDSDSPLATRRRLSPSTPRKLPAPAFPPGFIVHSSPSSSTTNQGPARDTQSVSITPPYVDSEDVEMADAEVRLSAEAASTFQKSDSPGLIKRTAKAAVAAGAVPIPRKRPRSSSYQDSIDPAQQSEHPGQSSTSEELRPHRQRNYTLDAFASGSFVYTPRASVVPKEGEASSPLRPPSNHCDREPGELTPLAKIKSIDGTLSAALGPHTEPRRVSMGTLEWQAALVGPALGLTLIPPPSPVIRAQLFDDNMRVLSFERGADQSQYVTLSFEIGLETFALLKSWANRYTTSSAEASYRCVSLACHPFSECSIMLDGPNAPDLAKLFEKAPTCWPLRAHPRAIINNGKGLGRNLPITPLSINRDNLVDISSQVQLGKNTIVVESTHGDTQDHIFVVHIHPPTTSQTQELQQRKDQENAWQEFLRDCTKIELPQPSAYFSLDASLLVV